MYGRLEANSTVVPTTYSGPALPNMQFVVWKIHSPNEEDTFDEPVQQPSAQMVSPREMKAAAVAKTAVPKNTALRRAIILGILEKIYKGGRKSAIANSWNCKITCSHFYIDGRNAIVRATAITAECPLAAQCPMLILLHKGTDGLWHFDNSYAKLSSQYKSELLDQGYPESMLVGL